METTKNSAERFQSLVRAYERFVPRQFLNLLGKDEITSVQFGDQIEKNMTILFSDIRGFTSLSEELTPQQTFNFLNSYLSQMEPVIASHNGIIDKYVGDAIMALFPASADDAVNCANAMRGRLEGYNIGRKSAGYEPVRIGIGLNSGLVILGTIGGSERMEGTVIGDAVNLASRIEGLSKKYEVPLLISEYTFYALKHPERISIRFLDRVTVKGKAQPQSVYEVFDSDPVQIKEGKAATKRMFEEALAHYHLKNIDVAKKMLQECLKHNPLDRPAQIYLDRCKAFTRTGVHESTGELAHAVKWTEDFKFGVAEIDDQHRALFSQCNKLLDALRTNREIEEVNEAITFLDTYVASHFHDEENLMEEYKYPFTDFQKWQHAKFSEYFNSLKQEIRELDDSNRYFILLRVQLLVVDWLVNHTLKLDTHLGRFIKRKAESVSN
ncbi:MAG: bacteriohemerythrin [Deltaproteobacteria bacterium]|nr:bacteriohemerythrin [Deltaproteobacteria bacterium]